MDTNTKQIRSLQILRAVAALAVVCHHAVLEGLHFYALNDDSFLNRIAQGGQAGVDLFFIISGVIITWALQASRPRISEFIRHRVARIVPTYWFYTTLALAIALLVPAQRRNSAMTVEYIVKSYAFSRCWAWDGH
ncbi:acyltransferase [uncultured Ramlibacter sp.]|uniref:acyltransferase family protein n=1 Tax=uncultured Ramlibacter sp. TaxID=260755 RepID=UPI002612B906|nr:acyltransferase [uncultured Ramlibacter sp.]